MGLRIKAGHHPLGKPQNQARQGVSDVKILHAAELHLDSPMRGLLPYEEAPVEELRMATRTALGNLVDAAIEEEVALLLLAGDIYDGNWQHYGTGLHFAKEMGRLREAG